jgi:membrane carboxypeptidase/penicillin-binding protein PbpC
MSRHVLGILFAAGITCVTIFLLAEWQREPLPLPKSVDKHIVSTVDAELQRLAEKKILAKIKDMKKRGQLSKDAEVAFICLDNETGDVLAYLGGNSVNAEKNMDFLLAKNRDTGSVIKPIFYVIALDTGAISATDVFMDEPMKFLSLDGRNETYSFDNYRNSYQNKALTIEESIADSSNVCMLQAYHRTDRQKLAGKMDALGMPLEDGKYNVNLLPVSWSPNLIEIASAYTTLANGGVRSSPRLTIDQPLRKTQVFSAESCSVALRGMRQVLTAGTGAKAAKDLASVARAKTGSSYDSLALLQTRKITMVIRVGTRNSVKDLKKTGGALALPLLADYTRELRRVRAELVPVWE